MHLFQTGNNHPVKESAVKYHIWGKIIIECGIITNIPTIFYFIIKQKNRFVNIDRKEPGRGTK